MPIIIQYFENHEFAEEKKFTGICVVSVRKNGWILERKIHMKNGEWHRTDGPAVEWSNGETEFWIHDACYMIREFWKHQLVTQYKLKNILDL